MINPLDSTSGSGSGLSITNESASYLKETGGWARFLAIVGFCFVALIVIIALFLGSMMGAFMPPQLQGMEFLITIIYLIIAAIYFFPILFLFRFAQKAITAVRDNDTATLTSALSNLKSHYKFIGIFTAIVVGLYALIFIGALLIGMAAG